MTARISLGMVVALLAANVALGQANGWQGAPAPDAAPQGQTAPSAAQATAPPQPQAPFQLTSPEQAQLDRALNLWQQASNTIKTFQCDFRRWQFTGLQANAQPVFQEGLLKYAAPDKGLFQVQKGGQEQWICDGKSIYEFNYMRKELVQHVLPPTLQGQAIVNGPLPFMFGAQAANLNARYWMRIVPSNDPKASPNEILLQAYPKYQQDAANFSRADIILNFDAKTKLLQPTAVQMFDPAGQGRTVYQFMNVAVNPWNLIDVLKVQDPFKAVPPGADWRVVVDNPPQNTPPQTSQATRPGAPQPNPR